MTKVDLQYDLVNYTPASASPPQANFNRIEQHVNQELIERDGTVAMRAQLKLVGDPVAPLDAAPKQYVDQILPVGIIMMYGGAAAPPGGRWALCNGAELQTTDYPELSALLGVAYGGSAGRFNLPNLTDKFPRGSAPGTSGGTADAVVVAHTHPIDHDHPAAMTGVESTVHSHAGIDHLHGFTGSTAGMSAQHTHTTDTPSVNFLGWGPPGSGNGQLAAGGNSAHVIGQTAGASGDHTHAFSGATQGADRSLLTGGQSVNHQHSMDVPAYAGASASTGVTGVNANLPPFVGVAYIIRVN